jgi:hypothetical protein
LQTFSIDKNIFKALEKVKSKLLESKILPSISKIFYLVKELLALWTKSFNVGEYISSNFDATKRQVVAIK